MTPKFMNEEFAIWKTSLQYIVEKGSHSKMHSNVGQFQILGWLKDIFFLVWFARHQNCRFHLIGWIRTKPWTKLLIWLESEVEPELGITLPLEIEWNCKLVWHILSIFSWGFIKQLQVFLGIFIKRRKTP
jgi:hypothetical protein